MITTTANHINEKIIRILWHHLRLFVRIRILNNESKAPLSGLKKTPAKVANKNEIKSICPLVLSTLFISKAVLRTYSIYTGPKLARTSLRLLLNGWHRMNCGIAAIIAMVIVKVVLLVLNTVDGSTIATKNVRNVHMLHVFKIVQLFTLMINPTAKDGRRKEYDNL